MKRRFVNTFNYLAIQPQLYYRNNGNYSSAVSAAMTILVGISFIIIVIYFFLIYTEGYGVTIISSIENVNSNILVDLNNKSFMFSYLESNHVQDPRFL